MPIGPKETILSHDYHTAGEPFRIVDIGPMQGETVLERHSWAIENLDDIRQFLVNEPRGHADMYGGFIVPPDNEKGDIGVVFFHNHGFSTACGHGTIALATWAVDTGKVPTTGTNTPLTIDVPSGRLKTEVKLVKNKVVSVNFLNVPSYVTATQVVVKTSMGEISIDVSFGGAFYASVDLDNLAISISPGHLEKLRLIAKDIKIATAGADFAKHRDDVRMSGIYGTIFHEMVNGNPLHQRNVTIFADGQVDRSPCGSGTSARLALLHEKQLIKINEKFIHDGIAGGRFLASIKTETSDGIITSIEGSAHRYATTTFHLDPKDPFHLGFLLR